MAKIDDFISLVNVTDSQIEELYLEEFAYGNITLDAQEEVNQLTVAHNWTDGYRLGLLLTAEAFVTG